MSKHKDLDILEDVPHQQLEWKLEWAGWLLMTVLVFGNLLGFFGHGIFNDAHVGDPGAALQVDYQKRERYKAVSFITLHIDPALAGTSPRVTIGDDFISKVRITEIVPEPESVEVGAGHQVYQFSLLAGEPVDVRIFFEPFDAGTSLTRIGLEDTLQYEFRQFFFP